VLVVRRLAVDEGPALRDLRLRGLRDAPFAFSQPIAEIEARRDDEWMAIAARRSASDREGSWVAAADGEFVGLVGGFFTDSGVVDLVAMWTAPESRRRGVGSALIDAVVEWARANGARTVRLAVTVGNEAAERLYEASGFRFTGAVEPMPHDPETSQRLMELRL
jgi:GNAT superfamily N-acetyltransferase